MRGPGRDMGNHLNGAQMRGGARELGLIQYWAQGALALGTSSASTARSPRRSEKLPELVGSIDTPLAGGGYDALRSRSPDPDDLTPFVRRLRARRGRRELGVPQHRRQVRPRRGADLPHRGLVRLLYRGDLEQYEYDEEWAKAAGTRPPRLLVGP